MILLQSQRHCFTYHRFNKFLLIFDDADETTHLQSFYEEKNYESKKYFCSFNYLCHVLNASLTNGNIFAQYH
jgi:hypothetical protein